MLSLGECPTHYRQGENVLLNKTAGTLVRSKSVSSNEGGIFVQAAAVDIVDLIPTEQFLNYVQGQQ